MTLKNYKCPIFIFFLTSLIFASPLFFSFDKIGIVDWDEMIFDYEVIRESILEYHQIPFWNPYYCGGNVLWAHPESPVFTLLLLFVLIFGTMLGTKLAIIVYLFIGLIAVYLLARQFKLTPLASYASAFTYVFSSQFLMRIGIGHFPCLAMSFYPLAFLFFIKGLKKEKYEKCIILSSFFIALAFFSGSLYKIGFFFLFISIYTLIKCFMEWRLKPLTLLIFLFLFTFLLASIKLIPALDFVQDNPRYALFSADESTSLKEFADDIFKSVRLSKYFTGTTTPDDPSWWEGSMGIGFIGTLLMLVGVFFCFKQEKALLFTIIIMVLIFLGNTLPISLWKLLHFFPPFSFFYVIGRMAGTLILVFALLAGFGFSGLEVYFNRRKFNYYFFVFLLIILFGSLFFLNWPILNDALRIQVQMPLEKSDVFFQTMKNYSYNGISGSGHYLAVQENKGDLICYEEARSATSVSAVPKESPSYKGEAYLEDDGKAKILYFSPNKIIVEVDSIKDSLLVLNQNYERNWRVKSGKIENYRGLLATKVPKGNTTVIFYYFPKSFIIGIIVTFSSFLILFFFIKGYNKKVLCLLVVLLILSSLFFIHSQKGIVKIPEIYHQLKMDKEKYSIIELPFTSPLFHAFQYYAKQHGKEVIWHHPSQKISYKVYLLKKIFFANESIDDMIVSDVIIQDPQEIALSVLNYYNIKNVLLHKTWYGAALDWIIFSKSFFTYDYNRYKDWYGNEHYNKTKDFLDRTFEKSYEDEEVIAYDVPQGKNQQLFGLMDEGWYGFEISNFNWMGNKVLIKIISPKKMSTDLKFKAFNFYETKHLEIYQDSKFIGSYKIDRHKEIVLNLKLNEGENKIEFKSKEMCKKPSKVSDSKDYRCLSIAVSELEIISK